MTDKAFEKWLESRLESRPEYWNQHVVEESMEIAWQACSEHYEAVMRRVLVELYQDCCKNYRSMGIPMAAEDYMDRVLKRALEAG